MTHFRKRRRHGRRWFTLDAPGKRGKRYWLVLGEVKLKDVLANRMGDELRRALDEGRVRYERIDDVVDRVIIDDESP